MSTAEAHAALFAGRWIGETQGCDAPAHVWEISANGRALTIETRWEGEARSSRLHATAQPDAPAFQLGEHTAELIGTQHFIVAGWDTNDTRGGQGPHYDVVFARPGLAELQTFEIWQHYRAEHQ